MIKFIYIYESPFLHTRKNKYIFKWKKFAIKPAHIVFVARVQDRRELLLPWIAVMVIDLLVECCHFVYLIILETVIKKKPNTFSHFYIAFLQFLSLAFLFIKHLIQTQPICQYWRWRSLCNYFFLFYWARSLALRILFAFYFMCLWSSVCALLAHAIKTTLCFLLYMFQLDFEPLTATLFTIDFFIMCLNVSVAHRIHVVHIRKYISARA